MVFWKKWRMIVRNVTASRSGGCFVGMSLEGGESLGDNVGRGSQGIDYSGYICL